MRRRRRRGRCGGSETREAIWWSRCAEDREEEWGRRLGLEGSHGSRVWSVTWLVCHGGRVGLVSVFGAIVVRRLAMNTLVSHPLSQSAMRVDVYAFSV